MKKNSTILMQYFTLTDNENKYCCLLCGNILKIDYRHKNNSVNHFKLCHQMEFDLILSKNNQINEDSLYNDIEDSIEPFSKFFGTSKVAFNLINDNNFKNLLRFYKKSIDIPSKHSIEKRLSENLLSYRKMLNNLLTQAIYYSFSIDLWSSYNEIAIAIIIKLSFQDKCSQSFILDIDEISNMKSSTIENYIINNISFWNVDIKKLISICTDNCSSMIKSMSLLKENLLNNFNEELNQENILDIKLCLEKKITIAPEHADIYNLDFEIKKFILNKQTFFYTGCFIHKIQLVILDLVKQSEPIYYLKEKLLYTIKFLKKSKFKKNWPKIPTYFAIR